MSLISSVIDRVLGRGAPLERIEPVFGDIADAPSRQSSADWEWWSGGSWGVPTAAGAKVNQATAMQVTAVYACVTMIAYDIAKLGATIFAGERKGKHTKAKNHFLYQLLRQPHPRITWFNFCAQMMMAVLLRGNGYAAILRNGRGQPISLWPLNPDRVQLWEAPDGSLWYLVTRVGLFEMALLREMPLLIPAEDILHLKSLTANGLLGLSPIGLAREAIGLSIAQEQMASYFAAHGARPGGILSTEQKLTKEQREIVEKAWASGKGGVMNAGKTAILEAGLKFEPLTLKATDMEFLASRGFQLAEIARIYRIPGYKVGIESKGGGKANVAQSGQEYLNDTLSVWIEMWEQTLALTFDIDTDEMFVDFDESRILAADIETRFGANRISLGGSAWMTVNEIRAQEGLEDIEGGDVLYRPVNTAPASSDVFLGNPDPGDPTVPGDKSAPGLGSDQTGEAAPGGGRPPENGGVAADPATK